MLCLVRKLDGLKGIANVVIHQCYHLQAPGKVSAPPALVKVTDYPYDNASEQIISQALDACEPHTY
jgi:hypothetical protein